MSDGQSQSLATGYLAHNKMQIPLGPRQGPWHGPIVES
jgi:hypothetical protein